MFVLLHLTISVLLLSKVKSWLRSFRLSCINWYLVTPPKEKNSRLTEFYDDYLDSYDDSSAPVPAVPKLLVSPGDSAAAWGRSNVPSVPPISVSRTNSRGPRANSYALTPGSGVRRKVSRRPTQRGFRMQSTYREDDEEGYASGDYDDDEFYELMKIRIKVCFNSLVGNDKRVHRIPQIHYKDEVRGMALTPETSFEEFMDKLAIKFDRSTKGIGLKFQDEDGGKVTIADESDFELAIETARTCSKDKAEGKLEIWCSDRI